MISKADSKFIRSLKQKKYRLEHKSFVVEGEKLVKELQNSHFDVVKGFSVGTHSTFQSITAKELESISQLTTPNQVLAVAKIPEIQLEWEPLENELVLVLDGVKDPGNLGTIIRIADWFGVKQIICSTDTVDAYNSKVVQASMGSIFRVYVHYTSVENFLTTYKKRFTNNVIMAAGMNGENAYAIKQKPDVLVMGSESHGLSKEVLDVAQEITIPRFGEAESLNVAVATGILCAQIKRPF